MDVRHIRDLLWAVREMRRGDDDRRRLDGLPGDVQALLRLPLGVLCAELAARLTGPGHDPRATDACVRFYGLGRLPEDLRTIAAGVPRAHDHRGTLGRRRVQQLIEQAEEELARRLAVAPIDDSPVRPGPPREDRPPVDAFFDSPGPGHAGHLRVLLRAWADVPDGDQRSALALRLFEEEKGIRLSVGDEVSHRETRRRLRRRARAILAVALERYAGDAAAGWTARPSSAGPTASPVPNGPAGGRGRTGPDGPHAAVPGAGSGADGAAEPDESVGRGGAPAPAVPDATALLLLGPCQVRVVGGGAELDAVLRSAGGTLDREALEAACAYARELVWAGSPDGPAVVGALRLAVLRAPGPVPASIVTRILAMATITARERDDPAGVVAGWEALRTARAALTSREPSTEAGQVVSRTMRAAQELAELYDRLGMPHQAMDALGRAFQLLDEHGDPEQDEEPFGWAQQLLYTRAILQRRAVARAPAARSRLRAAQEDARRAANLVYSHDLLPLDRALSAQAVLIDALLDEVEIRQAEGDSSGAAAVRQRARQAIVNTTAGWATVEPEILTARSNRLATLRSACRLALLDGDADEYRERRELLRTQVGEWMTAGDIEELTVLEHLAERRHRIRPLGLAGRGIQTAQRIGQRAWARGLPDVDVVVHAGDAGAAVPEPTLVPAI